MRKVVFTFASFLMLSGIMTANSVHADEGVKLELYTIDTKLESGTQEHIKGTEAQLSNVNENSMKFIKDIAFDAHISGNDYGIYPSIIIAQAVLESRNGTSGLSKSPYHNLFGIKGFYNGQSVQMKTKEDDGSGNLHTIYANFKKYPDREASLRDHGRLLREGLNGFYYGTWRENAKTPEEAAEFLEGRYATDTKYASKLMKIINDYNLERFDEPLTERDLAWLSSNSLDPWELPVVEDYKVENVQTWASGLNDLAKGKTKIKFNDEVENYNKYYIEEHLGLTEDFLDSKNPRFKRDPEVGDIAVYKVENSDNELIERYAIVEGSRIDSLLISEAITGVSGLHVIYRTVPRESLYKFEFISVAKLKEHEKSNNGIDVIDSEEVKQQEVK